jgi:uncharacterized protein YndB with AHSA1/START domain
MNQTKITAEPGKQEIFIVREFDAPRELVFRAVMDPKLISQWWGPRYLSTVVDKMDPRSGGQWRFINRDSEGHEYAFHGVYHEVLVPERVIDTFEFEGIPETGHASLETMTLEELPGERTRLTVHSVFQSVVDRDATLASGMEEGVKDTYNRLEDLLGRIK